MGSQWQIRRTLSERDDGERRWDYAFQLLLRWVQEEVASHEPASRVRQEYQNEDSPLCTSLDRTSTTPSND